MPKQISLVSIFALVALAALVPVTSHAQTVALVNCNDAIQPCQNRGTCTPNGFCICDEYYMGEQCETVVSEDQRTSYVNGGVSSADLGGIISGFVIGCLMLIILVVILQQKFCAEVDLYGRQDRKSPKKQLNNNEEPAQERPPEITIENPFKPGPKDYVVGREVLTFERPGATLNAQGGTLLNSNVTEEGNTGAPFKSQQQGGVGRENANSARKGAQGQHPFLQKASHKGLLESVASGGESRDAAGVTPDPVREEEENQRDQQDLEGVDVIDNELPPVSQLRFIDKKSNTASRNASVISDTEARSMAMRRPPNVGMTSQAVRQSGVQGVFNIFKRTAAAEDSEF